MKEKKKLLLSAISGAVLAFLIGKILNPVLEIAYFYFLQIGNYFIKSFSDSVYKNISNGFAEQSSLAILYLCIILFVFLLELLYVGLSTFRNSILQKYDDLEESINDMERMLSEKRNLPEQANSHTEENLDDLLAQNKNLKKELHESYENYKKDSTKKLSLLKICLVFSALFLLFIYGKQVFISSAIAKTTSNIEIISPYITDTEYKQLKSRYHSISSKSDFDSLTATLNEIATEHSIVLKK